MDTNKTMTRRQALKHIGFGALAIAGGYSLITSCKGKVKDEAANGTLVMAKKKDEITEIINLSFCMKKKDGSGSQDGLLLM